MPSWLIPVSLLPLALTGLLWAIVRERDRVRYALKPLCSLLFLTTAALQPRPDPGYAAWIAVALVFGALGDVALIGTARRWVAVGLATFLVSHVAYFAAWAPRAAESWPGPLGPTLAALALLALLAWTLRHVWPGLGRFKLPAAIYGGTLAAAAVAAISAWLGRGGPAAALAAAGLVLFLISDVAVARKRFGDGSVSNRLWGLPCYYAAQTLLAISIGVPWAGGPQPG